jgi:hypothetical protein
MNVKPVNLLTLEPIVSRLEEAASPEIRRVGSAADMTAATAPSLVVGGSAATVILVGGKAREIAEGSGPFRQVIDVTITVVVGVPLAGVAGEAGVKRLEGPVNAVRTAMFGWRHPDAQQRFAHVGESLESFDAKTGVLFYRLDFATAVTLWAEQ